MAEYIINDEIHSKNSIMTLYRIRDKNLEKLMKRNKVIYNNKNAIIKIQ